MTIIKSFFQASHPKKKIYLGIIVFLCVVIWMILLTQGMPFYDPDDWDHVLISDDTPWKLMIQNFITPWSTSENWVAQASMMDQVRNKRVFLGIVLKSITGVFGYKFFPYYLFSKVLFFAGTITLLFLILVSLNSSYRYAITGALFYLLVPANYLHALWISVPETMAHFFILLSVYLYLNLGISLDQGNLKFSYWRTLGFLFIAGWFAMKTKETAVILPLMLLAFTSFRFRRWSLHKVPLAGLILVLVYLAFLIFPVTNLGMPGTTFNWRIPFRLLLRNYNCGYADEPTSAFISFDHIWPVSMARTIGLPLLWIIAVFVFMYWFNRFFRRHVYSIQFLKHPIVGISVFWMLIELFLMGFFQPDPRYFSGTMIPMTILISCLIYCVVHQFQKSWFKKIWSCIVIIVVIWTLFENFRHVIWRRQQMGQRGNTFMNVAKVIYQDQFPNKPFTMRDLGLYYCPTYVPPPVTRPHLKKVTYYIGLGYTIWDKADGSLQEFDRFSKYGVVYYATDNPGELSDQDQVKLLAALPRVNESSLFEFLLYKLKRKKPTPFYVFKHL